MEIESAMEIRRKGRLTVAVSALNAVDNPGPGVPVVRSLREAFADAPFRLRIIGLCYGSLEPGVYMHDLVDASYQLPYPSNGEEAFFNRLLYVHQKEGIDVLIPNLDAELYPYIKLQKRLADVGIRTLLPTQEQFEEREKSRLCSLGNKCGIKVPLSIVCNSLNEFYAKEQLFQYPVVVKGRYYEAYIAYTKLQVEERFSQIAMKWGVPIIVQQFVDGVEFNVIGNGDGKGGLLATVPMRKMFITDKGKAWAGITVEDNELIRMAEKFVNQTHWNGPFELELIKTNGTNGLPPDYQLIEVNPRIPAWVYLATAAGQNIPMQIVKRAFGENVGKVDTHKQSYTVGKMFVRYSWDMIVDYSEYGHFSVKGECQKTN